MLHENIKRVNNRISLRNLPKGKFCKVVDNCAPNKNDGHEAKPQTPMNNINDRDINFDVWYDYGLRNTAPIQPAKPNKLDVFDVIWSNSPRSTGREFVEEYLRALRKVESNREYSFTFSSKPADIEAENIPF